MQVDKQRPSAAATPLKAVQLCGTPSPPVAMKVSGVHEPPGHAVRRGASSGGTNSDGRQCAPAQAGAPSGSPSGLMTVSPVHGHVIWIGALCGMSQLAIEHACVGACQSDEVGS